MQCLQRPEEDIRTSGTGVTEGCGLCGCWKRNLRLLEEEPVLLTALFFVFFPSPKALTILAPTQTLAPCLTSAPSMLASTMISEMELLQSSVATLELSQKPPSCFPRTNITTLPQQLPLLPGKVQHQKFKILNKAYPARHARLTAVHLQA